MSFEPMQSLESRRMLSASAFHAGSTLFVRGASHAANTIVVKPNAENTAIEVSIDYTTRKGVAKTFNASFPTTLGIEKLRVKGGKEADTITIEQAPLPAPAPTTSSTAGKWGKHGRRVRTPFDGVINAYVDGKDGNDTIVTGAGDDRIKAGGGDDSVSSGAGNDLVSGQRGDDLVKGEDGNDTLWGGRGDDSVEGGAGNDRLGGILGVNSLLGGDGMDTFVAISLDGQTTDYDSTEDVLITRPSKSDKDAGKDDDDDQDDDDKHVRGELKKLSGRHGRR